MNYKQKFRWALVIACALFIVLVLYVIRIRMSLSQNAPAPKYIILDTPTSRSEKSKQAEWDYRPSHNPRYEENTKVQQIGFITSLDIEPKIMPLFGQSMRRTHADRWVYFTATDQNQSIRLPVTFDNRDCMNDDVGCTEIYNDDIVKVPSYNNTEFKVSLYKKQIPHV